MKKLLTVLILASLAVGCTPVERTAYRIVVASKGFLDSERAAHPECATTSQLEVVVSKACTAITRATSAKDFLIDAVEVYCASPTFSGGTGTCTPPKKGTPGYQQASDKLQAAISVYEQAEKDLKGAVK